MLIMGRIRDWKKEKDFGLPGFVAAWGARNPFLFLGGLRWERL